ncbi:RsmB/NOP family class I SAM-dependent RNA methyltransferase [Anaerobranca gottschalkii]|uniref:NOL1/NOP2/sun family putative RNA methylase n=1 Tax=Anaerobranca gottschalkii DSM 13577 TaxID=1120990 RepID=A0A1I0BVT4_9FIRM|nr:RsmB/NOP family class I SAM-dependent RNA methyltransferase [Anaerobranca gottschalkii]SET10763.1 NOL1/NOP2/sun family putative RNA methylase [Anaerobranca gottschalkii DSM 13577]
MELPKPFLTKMEELLKGEFPSFLDSYNQPKNSGLRANSLKISSQELSEKLPYLKDQIPWCSDGFYYDDEKYRPAKHPYYYAGLYYIQEPSAMLPAELLDVQPYDKVLDLCAAPGGKSLQLAAKLNNTGLLVVNDINERRSKILLKNIERYGVKNILVLNESPQNIAQYFQSFFDKILVDAPCSGEGMFRKDPQMIKVWSEEEVNKYVHWQREILSWIPKLIKPGGTVVYSTCTFSPEENEFQVNNFLKSYPQFSLEKSQRIWPHLAKGEGHFVSVLKDTRDISPASSQDKNSYTLDKQSLDALKDFSMDIWKDPSFIFSLLPDNGFLVERKGHILWENKDLPSLKGLKVLRSGFLLGTIQKGRFKPSQALAMAINKDQCQKGVQIVHLNSNNEKDLNLAIRYLKGETISLEGIKWPKGWHLISIDHYPLGWAKSSDLWLKNEYPPGWKYEEGEMKNG